MKTATSAALAGSLFLALATALPAQDDGGIPESMLRNFPPSMIRTQVEFIEVSRDQLDDLMFGTEAPASDGELRREVGRLISQGKATLVETRMPVIYTLRCNLSTMLVPGEYQLVAALTPQDPEGVPDATRKVMVFVKCGLESAAAPRDGG